MFIVSEQTKNYQTNPEITPKQRLALEKIWIDSLKSLRDETSGESQEKIDNAIKFLNKNVYPGTPLVSEDGENFAFGHAGDKRAIGLVALFASDSFLHPAFKELIDNRTIQFNPKMRTIIIPSPKLLSSRWRGLVMFHELHHAEYYFNGNDFGPKSSEYWIEEQSAYRDESEIIRNIYGDKYVNFINESAKKISDIMRIGSLSDSQLMVPANECLSTVLDEAKYNFETNIRRHTVMLDLAFTALEYIGKGNPEDFALMTKNLQVAAD